MTEFDHSDRSPRDSSASEPWFPIILGFLLLISAGALVWMLVFGR